eukprot:CAMPEP_0171293064 /NCGR_PEP_ID=MMETSP0816-20121228/1145_1 /TAXON_ID=420281 /ORGANISM="Proboscia inermis, Strain CCAP1064/1" /LENGTH=64 /DNA_ID=CAMNT_0011763465 /DNA_START=345 /DNA_END=539 /DNA_ORIENTATION=-
MNPVPLASGAGAGGYSKLEVFDNAYDERMQAIEGQASTRAEKGRSWCCFWTCVLGNSKLAVKYY